MLVEARDKVARLKKQGRTVEEVISAKPTAPYDAEWGQGFQSPKSFLGWVYQVSECSIGPGLCPSTGSNRHNVRK